MPALDTTEILNWIVSGFVGLIFGGIAAWYTYRLQVKRENLAWQREKEKLQERFEQEKSLLELQYKQKLLELEKQVAQQQSNQLRAEILKGIGIPDETMRRAAQHEELQALLKSGGLLLSEDETITSPDERTFLKLLELINRVSDKRFEEVGKNIGRLRKELNSGSITEEEFQGALSDEIRKIARDNKETG